MPAPPTEGGVRAGTQQTSFRYSAFISYSNAADGKLAPALQKGLQHFARPYFQLRALRVFRDTTDLSANASLWGSVEAAIDQSQFMVLLASPQAAASRWVKRELAHWIRTRQGTKALIIVLTGGTLRWDPQHEDFDWEHTTALPSVLDWPGNPSPLPMKQAFSAEPLWIDLQWARTAEDLSLRNPAFQDAVATIAATLHGKEKSALIGDDVREHARFQRLRRGVIAILSCLLVLATGLGAYAFVQREAAEAQRVTAERERDRAEAERDRAGRERDRAELERIAAQAGEQLPTSVRRSVLLAAAALDRQPVTQRALVSPAGAQLWRGLATLGGLPLPGHDDPLEGLVASDDGRWVVAWSASTALVYDMLAANHHATKLPVDSPVTARFTPSSDQVIVVDNTAMHAWSLPAMNEVWKEPTSVVETLAMDASGRWLVAGCSLWERNNASWRKSADLAACKEPATSIAFASGSRWFVVASAARVTRYVIGTRGLTHETLWEGRDEHSHAPHEVRISRGGRWVAAIRAGSSVVRLWRIGGRRVERAIELETSEGPNRPDVMFADFSEGDRWLVSANEYYGVRLWDVTGDDPAKKPTTLSVAQGSSIAEQALSSLSVLSLDDAGRRLAAGAGSRLLVWHIGARDATPQAPAWAVSFDQRTFVRLLRWSATSLHAGMHDGSVWTWDTERPAPAHTGRQYRGHDNYVNGIALTQQGFVSASISSPNGYIGHAVEVPELRAWRTDAATAHAGVLPVGRGHLDMFGAPLAAISTSERWLVTSAGHGFMSWGDWVRVLDTTTQRWSAAHASGHVQGVQALAVGRDIFATAGGSRGGFLEDAIDDANVRVWSMSRLDRPVASLKHAESIHAVELSRDDNWLIARGDQSWLWDLRPLRHGGPAVLVTATGANAISIARDGAVVCIASNDNLERIDGTRVAQRWAAPARHVRIIGVTASGDCAVLDTSGELELRGAGPERRYRVKVEDTTPTELLQSIGSNARTLVFGGAVISYGRDLNDNAVLLDTELHSISPEGRYVAVTDDRETTLIDLWSPTERVRAMVEDRYASNRSFPPLFSPDGQLFVTSDGSLVRVRDLARTDEPILAPTFGRAVAISNSGRWLVTASELGTVEMWPLRVQELLEIARRHVGRDLTDEERRVFRLDNAAGGAER